MPDRIVLGFDPATRATGWAVLAVDGGQERLETCGVFRARGEDLTARLASIYVMVEQFVYDWEPDLVAVETVYHGPNASTTIALAEVGAAVRLAAHRAGAAILDVAPAQRATVLGLAGNATKPEIRELVNGLYEVTIRDHNASDAVAIAAAGAAELRREAMGLAGLM